MAHINCTFFSKVLNKEVRTEVIIPAFTNLDYMTSTAEERFHSNRKFKTLTLLHGFSGNETVWTRYSSVERYAERYQLAVICPDGNNGHYSDWAVGPKYLTFLQEELLPTLRAMFPLSEKREDNYVAGLSMGGYGAFKWAFTYPETFSRVINFSGGVDIRPRLEFYKSQLDVRQVQQVYGEDLDAVPDGPDDIFWLMRQRKAEGKPIPMIYSTSGTEDKAGIYSHNRLVNVAQEIGAELTVYTEPGHHDFWFWDKALKRVITSWLPLTDLQVGLEPL